MGIILFFIGGLLLGLAIGLGVGFFLVRATKQNAQEKQASLEAGFQQLKDSFSALSAETLSKTTQDFFALAEQKFAQQKQSHGQDLENKKGLIDQTFKTMQGELHKVTEMVKTLEKDRETKFGELTEKLAAAATETQKLQGTTSALEATLSNSRVRGQWGDRMAEDVLRLAGFIEGINYRKQATHTDNEGTANRPDYTFYLPQDRVVHMDVKFPLENYLGFQNAENKTEKEQFLKQFLKDTRARIKEAATRAYITNETLDYVLVFIPNEQVYAFLHEHDRTLLDDALNQKVILCSPMTLYAILAVIRQAVENFQLERTAGEMLDLLGTFQDQWQKFVVSMDKLGERIASSQKEYDTLMSTRKNQLERPLRQIEHLRETSAATAVEDKPALKLAHSE